MQDSGIWGCLGSDDPVFNHLGPHLCADPVPLLRHEASGVDVQVQSDGVMLKGKPRASKEGAPAKPSSEGEGVLGLNSGFMYVY